MPSFQRNASAFRINKLSVAIAALGMVLLLTGQTPAPEPVPADTSPTPDEVAMGGGTEAPTGFDNLTNGYLDQGPPFDSLNSGNVVPRRSFNDDRFIFEQVEVATDGLGPTYNAQSCRECHQNVVTGTGSQIAELRTLRYKDGVYYLSIAGTLVQARATYAEIVERAGVQDNVRTLRIATSTVGDGFVECVADATLLAIRNSQPVAMRGMAVMVPVLEAPGTQRVGRFGWKGQQASLVSFSADAYLNEMGITSPLQPDENLADGMYVGWGTIYDPVQDPEDDGNDVLSFADFMRSTKAPPRGAITSDVVAGERIFAKIGCCICHKSTLVTAPPGTVLNGGTFTVPAALGSKIIHPYSDFLLHDIGTGDGIPLGTTPQYLATANRMRTAPLWGLRIRNRLMHDGLSFTIQDAIQRHGGQAAGVKAAYNFLWPTQKMQLLAFLDSL